MYEDDVIQEGESSMIKVPYLIPFLSSDAAVRQFPHETESDGDDQDGANEQPDATPDPTTSSRLQRQQPSRQGKVAYVIYGGQGSEAGVYYNWYTFHLDICLLSTFNIPYRRSCLAVIRRYHRNTVPPYLGFNAEEQARSSFAAFQATGQLPAGLFLPVYPPPLDGVQSSVPSSQTPPLLTLPLGMTPTSPFSGPAVNSPSLRTPHTPVRAAPQVQSARTFQAPVRPAREMRANSGSTSSRPNHERDPLSPIPTPLSPMRRDIGKASVVLFYLVIEGDAPGVYGSR
jgi:hypothetical protein